ncbi:hypothetical protein CKO28_12840 [Rhodovibrio sodomensis]|uniref:Uncharacterized protein n=1 Tax=Rhodovibrio sodomensis TaxID=1088 RepID=A0ABS1DGQ9_9PROT|nr:hypothetical protein [Rhodovibrio sodomensis]
MGSVDTDACSVLLRMKSKVCQELNDSFMPRCQPQAGVSKHPIRVLVPASKNRLWAEATKDGGCRTVAGGDYCLSKTVAFRVAERRAVAGAGQKPFGLS